MTYDVAVIGGGAAGSVFATCAAKAGARVVVFDGAARREDRIGESLSGAAVQLLRQVGFVPSPRHSALDGGISVWGEPTPIVVDYFARPHGAGLRLDRPSFDLELRRWAREAGCEQRSAFVGALDDRAGTGATVLTSDAEYVRADFVVDASGQSSFAARKFGAVRSTRQSLFAVYGVVAATTVSCACTLVASAADGWWYAVALPRGGLLASFHCDIDHARRLARNPAAWLAGLKDVPTVGERFGVATEDPPQLAIANAASAGLDASLGDRWLAIGDAARSFDPVTSFGLLSAIHDGVEGAGAVLGALSGDKAALRDFVRRRTARHTQIERQCRDLYRDEKRWLNAPFWAWRQQREANHGDDLRGNRQHA